MDVRHYACGRAPVFRGAVERDG